MSDRNKKFISYYKPYRQIFFKDMFCAVIASAITLVFPMLTRYITNDVLGMPSSTAFNLLVKIGIFMLVLIFIEYMCNYYVTYRGHIMGAYMEADMRDELYQHYTKLSFSFYDDQKVGQLMTRLTNDLFSLTELYHHGPEDLVISIVKIMGAFIILLTINVTLALSVFIVIPVMIIFSIYYNKKMKRAFKANRAKIGDINSRIEDSLSGIRVVKSFANEENEMKRFQQENNLWLGTKKNNYHIMGRYHAGLTAFLSMLTVIVVIGGGLLISRSDMNAGDLIAFLLYMGNLTDPIKRLIDFNETFQDGITGFNRFMDLLEIEPDIKDKKDAHDLVNVSGDVEFKNVCFSYDENGPCILNNINLKVKAGEYVALVGQSGVGKTTLCSLIPRFYEVTSGEILIDGQSIADIRLKSLRDHIGVVQQDVYLFAGTIMDNIAYGDPDASDEDIIKAAKFANAHEFIEEMDDGYQTDIGARGVKLSGGQKQRISIARVFLKNPPILIFDEATSALDNESEQIVQQSLEALAKDRTTFVIAHRLSTIKNAERIIVLGDEGVVESGNHEELIKLNGEYAKLYNMQFR